MTRPAPAAYLQSMFVRPEERGAGVSAALVERAHAELDAHRVAVRSALRAGESEVRAVLEPDGIPAAMDDLGGAPAATLR